MTEPEISMQVMIDELTLIALGIKDWLERAKKGEIERPPEEIERKTRRLEILRAIHQRLKRP